jgi:hypothetical protein
MDITEIDGRAGSLLLPSRRCVILCVAVLGALLALYLMPRSRDFMNYERQIEHVSQEESLSGVISSIELLFPVLFYLTSSLGLSSLLPTCLGLYLKLSYFETLGEVGWSAAGLYFARFFIVHEVTQIRASFAIALLLAGYLLLRKSRTCQALLLFLLAVTSHLSVLAYLPVLYYAAVARNPRSVLRPAFGALLVLLLVRSFYPFNLTQWGLDALLPDRSRLLAHLLDTQPRDVPGLLGEKLLLLKILVIGLIAFPPGAIDTEPADPSCSDWAARSALILTFSCLSFVVLYENFTIAARLSDLAAPFECALLAAFIWQLSKLFCCLLGECGALLIQLALTIILAATFIGPQLLLLD